MAVAAYDPVDPAMAPLYEYVYQELIPDGPTVHAAQPGQHYYGEFSVSLADTFGTAVRQLGMYLAPTRPGIGQYGNQHASYGYTSLLRSATYDASITNPPPPPVVPQIYRHAPTASGFLDDKTGWTRVAGCFEVPAAGAPLSHLIIGNFNEETAATTRHGLGGHTTTGIGNCYTLGDYADVAMYYLSNVRLHAFPTAGPDVTAACSSNSAYPTIGEGCALPISSSATYQWSFRPGPTDPFTILPGSSARQPALQAEREGDYQLVVSVPEIDGSGTYTATTQCHVTLTASITLAVTASANPICPAPVTNVTLTATGAPAGAAFTWQAQVTTGSGAGSWTTLTAGPSGASSTVHPTRTTQYRVRASSGTSYSCWTYYTVDVWPAPAVAHGGPYVFSQGLLGPWLLAGSPPTGATSNGIWAVTGGLIVGHIGNKWQVDIATATPGAYPATYTYTDPVTGCSAAASTTILIQECAALSGGTGTTLPTGVLSSNFVFQPYTRYHLSGPLVLANADFVLPEGCEILCDNNASITVGRSARLTLRGAKITAACNQMWPGITVAEGAYGLYMGLSDYNPLFVVRPESPNPADGIKRVNEISFARTAVLVEDPEHTEYRLTYTKFLHNERNVQLGLRTLPAKAVPVGDIINCTFDADPALFKAPLAGQGLVSEYALSTNLWDMRACTIQGNYVANMLVGILGSEEPDKWTALAIGNPNDEQTSNLFHHCLLAAIAADGISATDNRFDHNTIRLPDAFTGFHTPQVAAFGQAHPFLQPLLSGAAGMYLTRLRAEVRVQGNRFLGNCSGSGVSQAFTDFDQPGYYAQTGLHTSPEGDLAYDFVVNDNEFTNLATAYALRTVHTRTHAQVRGNRFADCAQSLTLTDNRVGQPAMPPALAPMVWVSCNTFERTSPAVGDSYGITLNRHATVQFSALAPGTNGTDADVMKNLFAGTGVNGIYTHVWNDAANPTVSYRTFDPASSNPSIPQTNTSNMVMHNATILPGVLFDNVSNVANDCGNEDDIWDYGILTRPAADGRPAAATLVGPTPNPADEAAMLRYTVPSRAASAELIVRESLQGAIVHRQRVAVNEQHALLPVRDLRPGLYLVSLLIDGRPMAAQRLQITR